MISSTAHKDIASPLHKKWSLLEHSAKTFACENNLGSERYSPHTKFFCTIDRLWKINFLSFTRVANSVKSTPSMRLPLLLFLIIHRIHTESTSIMAPREGVVCVRHICSENVFLQADPVSIFCPCAEHISRRWGEMLIGLLLGFQRLQAQSTVRVYNSLHTRGFSIKFNRSNYVPPPLSCSKCIFVEWMLDVGWRVATHLAPYIWPTHVVYRHLCMRTKMNCHVHKQPVWRFLFEKRRRSFSFVEKSTTETYVSFRIEGKHYIICISILRNSQLAGAEPSMASVSHTRSHTCNKRAFLSL